MVQQTKYLALIQENGFLILALPLTSYQCFYGLSGKRKLLPPALYLYRVVLASDITQMQVTHNIKTTNLISSQLIQPEELKKVPLF